MSCNIHGYVSMVRKKVSLVNVIYQYKNLQLCVDPKTNMFTILGTGLQEFDTLKELGDVVDGMRKAVLDYETSNLGPLP